jgi:predicted DNA-binding transcriptional regulator AlpA
MPKLSADLLPKNLPPVLIDRITASAYLGVSPSFFDELVETGRMPRPRRLGDKRKGWLVRELNRAANALPAAHRPQFAQSA